jgi:UDP-N-acetylglucosamine--N-acetylmuramyl-(pentapeptide) pyrophosphoryl-undecaprenol N-acetylglucosamine transferase
MTRTVLIAAGGTGGHLFPAEALAHELAARDIRVELVTDHRATSYGGSFPAGEVHVVSSATLAGRSPIGLARAGLSLGRGMVQSFALVNRVKPVAVVGFGGYPTIPPLVAAAARRVPTVIHEANAVAGRANRFLAGRVSAVATTFERTGKLGDAHRKTVRTGNPVRPAVVAAATDYRAPEPGGPYRLVVFGGSQGARIFADIVPAAVARLAEPMRGRLSIVQQARPEDVDRVQSAYAAAGVEAVVAPFFADLPARLSSAHLVIGRSGASTLSELAVIGRPSILVPLPHAIDNDQLANALEMQRVGGAVVAEQKDLTVDRLAALIAELVEDPARLTAMAEAAGTLARPDAVARLADLVLHVAGGGDPAPLTQGH